jgi:hypothetical protein
MFCRFIKHDLNTKVLNHIEHHVDKCFLKETAAQVDTIPRDLVLTFSNYLGSNSVRSAG